MFHKRTRWLYQNPGWFGDFDNCLWDIAGKAAELYGTNVELNGQGGNFGLVHAHLGCCIDNRTIMNTLASARMLAGSRGSSGACMGRR
jgi:hypothetical protein